MKVVENGIHQITDEQLIEMGFTDPSKVAVFGYPTSMLGGNNLTTEIPDDLPATPVWHRDGKLLFYAEGDAAVTAENKNITVVKNGNSQKVNANFVKINRNFYYEGSTYFLTDSQPVTEIETSPYIATALDEAATTSLGLVRIEEDNMRLGTYGAILFGRSFLTEPRQTYTFSMPGYSGGTVYMQYVIGVRPAGASFSMPITLPNGVTERCYIATRAADNWVYAGEVNSFAVTKLATSADNTYSTTIDMPEGMLAIGATDYITAAYPRDNVITNPTQELFTFCDTEVGAKIELTNTTDNTVVWEISNRANPIELTTVEGYDNNLYFTLNSTSRSGVSQVVAFNPDATFPSVENLGTVANQNLHALETPRMLIVTSKNYRQYAEQLAQAHRDYGQIDVQVVLHDDIYNEFSSGAPSVMAIRRCAKMFYDRDPEKFRSLLIFAPALYDVLGREQADIQHFRDEYVPIFECEDISDAGHISLSYATDTYFGMLQPNDDADFDITNSNLDINVARIPAGDDQKALAYLNRAINYLKNPPVSDAYNRAIEMCDDGDKNGHMEDAEAAAQVILAKSPSTTVFRGYNTIYPWESNLAKQLNSHVITALTQGVAYVGYSGHAALNQFGTEHVWDINLSQTTDYNLPPFVMLATCRSAYIDHNDPTVGPSWLFSEKGGAIAVVGSLREVFKEQNQVLNLKVANAFFSANNGATMGDIFRIGRNAVYNDANSSSVDMSSNDRVKVRKNTLSYNLIGDPEILTQSPDEQVTLTTVNGAAVANETINLKPETTHTFAGVIRDKNGNLDSSFNGELFIAVFDGPHSVKVINYDDSDVDAVKNAMVQLDENQIYQKRVAVENGQFSADVYLPVTAYPEAGNRVSFFAIADDNITTANGVCKLINILDANEIVEPADETAPQITEMYLDTPQFSNGDLIGASATLHATMAPNTFGITGTTTTIGRSMVLSLDGTKTYSNPSGFFVADQDGGGVLDYPISDLTDGAHEITLRVFNYAGQSATRSISFEVVGQVAQATLSVEEYPAAEQATVTLTHAFSIEPTVRLIIKDVTGKAIYSASDVTFPYVWDLTDANGDEVTDGVYTIEGYLNSENRYGIAPATTIVVRR